MQASFAPELETRRPAGRQIPAGPAVMRSVQNSYDGASTARRVARWHAPTTSPNSLIGSLSLLRDRSRQATRNDGYAKGAIDELVSNIIGTGITPLSKADDAQFRKDVQVAWLQWTDEADADGLLEFYGLQVQAARTWLTAGECFIRLRPRLPDDGLSVPLQVQVLEPELCPINHDVPRLPNGNRIRAGLEFDGIGRRVAYWFHPSRPGDPNDYEAFTLKRVPASNVIHLFDPLRPGQLRGEPLLTPALLRLWEVSVMDDALLMRHKLANMFVGFLKRPAQTSDQATDPFTGTEIDNTDAPPAISMEPGLWQELNPGEEVEFSDPPDVSSSYPDFMRLHLASAAAGTGIPYEVFTGDMSKVNDRSLRVILQRFRRRVMQWQHQVIGFQLCQRVWRTWLEQAYFAGALALPDSYLVNAEPWARVRWMPQAWPYIHPVQDVQADKLEIRAGLSSRSSKIAERGEDAEVIDAEQAADNARAKALGLTHDSNAADVSAAGVTQGDDNGSTEGQENAA